jgi:hypothetical protein
MSGDSAGKNDDELLSQIDELKARMDRLMRGGSSTSNSALLTDSERPKPEEPKQPEPEAETRTKVRDLIDVEDTELVEVYPGPKEVVPFPVGEESSPKDRRPQPSAPPAAPVQEPPAKPRPATVGGSVISLDDGLPGSRPQVESFDDLGSAVQHEIEKDDSVPPAEAKKGLDLANRFGPVDEQTAVKTPPQPTPQEELDASEDDVVVDDEPEATEVTPVSSDRNATGLVAAIWASTAVVSGLIAVLHFAGAI